MSNKYSGKETIFKCISYLFVPPVVVLYDHSRLSLPLPLLLNRSTFLAVFFVVEIIGSSSNAANGAGVSASSACCSGGLVGVVLLLLAAVVLGPAAAAAAPALVSPEGERKN